jgi:nucleotide-binding universal stress UspA family protein
MPIKRILCASDFSPASRAGLRLATELAEAFRAELILCHAYPPALPVVGEGPVPPALLQQVATEARAAASAKLTRLARSVNGRRIRISTVLADGPASEAIVATARKKRVHLVVLGSHGRAGLTRLLMGSVAESVVRTASCPVLTVRPGRSGGTHPRAG